VENVLDEDYEEIPTYNTSGAAAYAGLRYSF
jgi:vitamin B12 transporter